MTVPRDTNTPNGVIVDFQKNSYLHTQCGKYWFPNECLEARACECCHKTNSETKFPYVMDNAGYIRETDLSKKPKDIVRIALQTRETPTSQEENVTSVTSETDPSAQDKRHCKPNVCKEARRRASQYPSSSPWHKNKTYYLLGILILLVLWIIIYSVLNSFNML